MSIQGLGIDIVNIDPFREQLNDQASSFIQGSFTFREQVDVKSRPNKDKVYSFAARYAAKEAFIKAWSAMNRYQPPVLSQVNFLEIEVPTDSWHRPFLILHGEIRKAMMKTESQLGLELKYHVSLSHDVLSATSVVLIES